MHQGPPLFPIFRVLSRSLHSHSSKANFTQSIQPNLGLPHTRLLLASAINTLLAMKYSSILSTCPNHLNTLLSAQLANSLSISAILHISSFLTLYICDSPTKLVKHFISRTFNFLLSALLISHAQSAIQYHMHSPPFP